MLSQEGVLRLAPEVVVDLAPECADDPQRRDELRAAWELLRDVPAVRDGRVRIVLDDAALIPGPRFVETLDLLAEALDPTGRRPPPVLDHATCGWAGRPLHLDDVSLAVREGAQDNVTHK
jgi:hypothetical protein